MTFAGWILLAGLADSSGIARMSEKIPLNRASPKKLAGDFQDFFRAQGLTLQPAPGSAVVLGGPRLERLFNRGKHLVLAMDVDDRFLDPLRARATEYDYPRNYSLAELLNRVDRFLEGERLRERFWHFVRKPRYPYQGCGGEAWEEWRSRNRWLIPPGY